jgi:hypothetical protein
MLVLSLRGGPGLPFSPALLSLFRMPEHLGVVYRGLITTRKAEHNGYYQRNRVTPAARSRVLAVARDPMSESLPEVRQHHRCFEPREYRQGRCEPRRQETRKK